MESTETTTHIPPSALAIRLKWDVFLSFRGVDTRDDFTTSLFNSLEDQNVRPFMDTKGMQPGEEISPTLIEAIEDSAAAIAVISPRYAESHWCLEELAIIFENKRLVLPVFYQVEPRDVRKQGGPFEEAFRSHEKTRKETEVLRWRNALRKAGNLSGYPVNRSDDDHQVQKIVRRVLEEIKNVPVRVFEYTVGLDYQVEELLSILGTQSTGVQVLGIHGTPGIGKTTLAKALFNKLCVRFEKRSFILNLKDTLKRHGVAGVQIMIISHFCKVKPAVDEEVDLTKKIRNIVRDSCALVVLDDVDDARQLDVLGIRTKWFGEGSKIIMTSRNTDVWLHSADRVDLYEVKQLDHSDAMELFSYHSLRNKPSEKFANLAEQIVSLTGGLPLALEVFGSSLLDKRKPEEWEDSLKKLKETRPSSLQGVLKLSYDVLDDEEKCIFLDISCLFLQVEMSQEDAIDIFEGCGFKAVLAVGSLIKKSLLKITENHTLWMHDQIRDMGRQIVIEENFDPAMRSRLWDSGVIMNLLRDKMGTCKTRGIVLNMTKNLVKDLTTETISWYNFREKPNVKTAITFLWERLKEKFHNRAQVDENKNLCTESFEPMVKLKLLQINYAMLEGDFKYMPPSLRWLKWNGCPWRSFPADLPRDITVLDLSESKIEYLWGKAWLPWHRNEVAKNLMVMNLRGCCSVKALPNLSQHKNLKKLILERCVNLAKLHESVGNLTSLVLLNLRHCTSLLELPCDMSGLRSLEEFILSGCSKLKRLPDDISSMKSLVKLLLDETAICELPESIHQLKKLQLLNLSRCNMLTCLPECIGHLDSLQELYLSGSALQMLPSSIGMMSGLDLLSLAHCSLLTGIPDSIRNLRMLTTLYLDGSAIKQLPDSIRALSHLKVLSAGMCRSLTRLPASVEGLASMIELQLNRTPLCELPEQIGSLKMIEKLEMYSCTSLRSLPASLGNMLTLSVLVITNAAITNLPESIGMLENLVRLNLNNCKQLQCLPESIGQLKALYHLQMAKTAIRTLPKSFWMLTNLRTLEMGKDPHFEPSKPNSLLSQDQPQLVEFPTSFSEFSSLVELDARAWRYYGHVPDDFEKLSSLVILNLGNNNFCSLPSSLRGLSVLQKLLLPQCEKLESLPPLPSTLLELNVANCYSLASICDLSNLKRLQELRLANCHKVLDVPGLECLMSLRRLFMGGCNASASALRRKMSKACLKKFDNLSFPGSRIPQWFSQEVIYSAIGNRAVKGVVIAVVVSVRHELLDEMRAQLPCIANIKASILRLDMAIHTTALYLMGVPKTSEDQIHFCRFRDYRPLVSMLKHGDKLQVSMSPASGIELKEHGIHLVYEDEDDYDGSEDLVVENHLSLSEKLVRFIHSLDEE